MQAVSGDGINTDNTELASPQGPITLVESIDDLDQLPPGLKQTIEWALHYAGRGIRVFPVRLDKRPFKSAEFSGGAKWGQTTNPYQILRDFQFNQPAYIGAATGKESNLTGLDLDRKNGVDGVKALCAYDPSPNRDSDDPPAPWVSYSRNNGMHLLGPYIPGLKTSSGELGPGIDVRNDGGYIILPDRYMTDPDEPAYRWDKQHNPKDRPELSPFADWIQALATRETKSDPTHLHQNNVARALSMLRMAPEGQRNVQLNKCAFAIGRASLAMDTSGAESEMKDIAHGLGLSDSEIRATMRSGLNAGQQAARQQLATTPTPIQVTIPTGFPGAKDIGELVEALEPEAYVIDGVLPARQLLTLTGFTGTGKTALCLTMAQRIAQGKNFGGREVDKGSVLICAGENPDNMLRQAHALFLSEGIDPCSLPIRVVSGRFTLGSSLDQLMEVMAEMQDDLRLVLFDTLQAFYEGENENDNTEMQRMAKTYRYLQQVPGDYSVLIPSHPAGKNEPDSPDELRPRGGGAFLNEIDGNIQLFQQTECGVLLLQSDPRKFRSAGFKMHFRKSPFTHPELVDAKGRPVKRVVVKEMTDDAVKQSVAQDVAAKNAAMVQSDAKGKIEAYLKAQAAIGDYLSPKNAPTAIVTNVFRSKGDPAVIAKLLDEMVASGALWIEHFKNRGSNSRRYRLAGEKGARSPRDGGEDVREGGDLPASSQRFPGDYPMGNGAGDAVSPTPHMDEEENGQ